MLMRGTPTSEGNGGSSLGVHMFYTAAHSVDQCGANGLPLTPNSIRVYGLFKKLISLRHPGLCRYVDAIRGKHECVMVVSEYYGNNLRAWLSQNSKRDESTLIRFALEMMEALAYLHSQGIVHRNLCLDNVLLNNEIAVKLSSYGLYHMTDGGHCVSFPIGTCLAPEDVLRGPVDVQAVTARGASEPTSPFDEPLVKDSGWVSDSWSAGVIVLELALGHTIDSSPPRICKLLKNFKLNDDSFLTSLVSDEELETLKKSYSPEFLKFIENCLQPNPAKRKAPFQLLQTDLFKGSRKPTKRMPFEADDIFSVTPRSQVLSLPEEDADTDSSHGGMAAEFEKLDQRMMYHLWQLAGGDVENCMKRAGLLKAKPPILTLCSFVSAAGVQYGSSKDRNTLYSPECVPLPMDQLKQKLAAIRPEYYYPLIKELHDGLPAPPNKDTAEMCKDLPIVIRERDVEYQFHRLLLFSRLLDGYPFHRKTLIKEARQDIPPLLRPHIWAAALDVQGDVYGEFSQIDTVTPRPIDRQIEVDIPRCHQYSELMSSPEAHRRLRRVLKAWVVSHPQYVYWQGLDSLATPFVYLNFNNEALAYACYRRFISKYLHRFFLKDNSAVIQEYLLVFSQLITFLDPELSNHLNEIGFVPDLYAIPWFLTLYAHVFPIYKLVHLWDTLLLGATSFPLFIGVAILTQLKPKLAGMEFNDCILLFSDLPEINIEQCVRDSVRFYCGTPKSCTYREHAGPSLSAPPPSLTPSSQPGASVRDLGSAEEEKEFHTEKSLSLMMSPVPLAEHRGERCPRISAHDLLDLLSLDQERGKPKLITIDIRGEDGLAKGIIPGCISLPADTSFGPRGQLIPTPKVDLLRKYKVQVKVVVGNQACQAAEFANKLVLEGFSKVCVLHGGIQVLRNSDVLTVPTSDISS